MRWHGVPDMLTAAGQSLSACKAKIQCGLGAQRVRLAPPESRHQFVFVACDVHDVGGIRAPMGVAGHTHETWEFSSGELVCVCVCAGEAG